MATIEHKIKVLQGKKEQFFRRIQTIYNYSKDLNVPENKQSFLTKIQTLQETRDQFNSTIEEINLLQLQLKEDFQLNFQALEAFDDLYCKIIAAEKSINQTVQSQIDSKPQQSRLETQAVQNIKPKIKLPTLELPGFSGDIHEWPVFYETFRVNIHENPHLTDADKIRYLLGKLSKRALFVTSGIPPTAENYPILWKVVVDRYQDKRSLATFYLNKILEFKPISRQSSQGLENFLQYFVSSIDALKALNIEDLADFILLHIALSKLDSETVRSFEMESRKDSIPLYKNLITFIKENSKILSRNGRLDKQDRYNKPNPALCSVVTNKYSKKLLKCVICDKLHHVYQCPDFKKLSPANRYSKVIDKKLCVNCLSSQHNLANCKSSNTCLLCDKRHHSAIHYANQRQESQAEKVQEIKEQPLPSKPFEGTSLTHCSTSSVLSVKPPPETVLLSTAQIYVFDVFNQPHVVRVLLDSASQSNFITAHLHSRLGLKKSRVDSSVLGIGTTAHSLKFLSTFSIASRFNRYDSLTLDAFVIDKITDNLPSQPIDLNSLSHLRDLQLADNDCHVPGKIDLLLGADIFSLVLKNEKISGPSGSPAAFATSFGYILMGKCKVNFPDKVLNNHVFVATTEDRLEDTLKRFWSVEEVPTPKILSKEDEKCESHFVNNFKRLSTGRYSVSLPFKEDPSQLGDSLPICKRRFLALEKRLNTNENLRSEYHAFMKDYIDQGHMSPSTFTNDSYYLPHHCVIKPESVSTRLRVVFDASAKDSTNRSLNDFLYTGPKLHCDLVEILIRFRLFQTAVTADVRQMYRQIDINSEDRRYQKILWRFSPTEELRSWTLNTVTFGVKPAPFLALRVTRQLAIDEASNYPDAALSVNHDIYMDDFVTSIENLPKALNLCVQMRRMFRAGGFELVKWASNSSDLMSAIPLNEQLVNSRQFSHDHSIKILGLRWISASDHFYFQASNDFKACTKRNILSAIARIFDPLGLIAPVTLFAKVLLKRIWSIKLDWDETPPESIMEVWNNFQGELPQMNDISIPRWTSIHENLSADLVCFCDASNDGYGAAIYIRAVQPDGEIKSNLLCAKSRVSPAKTQSIPRLELLAAVLLTRLTQYVMRSCEFRFKFQNVFAFSDSTIVIQWINNSPSRWKTFVANRVAFIQENLPPEHWGHINGDQNPSDCLSRGLLPASLLHHPLWFKGPKWITQDYSKWPKSFVPLTNDTLLEQRALVVTRTFTNPLRSLINKFSSYIKLLRSAVYVLRFIKVLPNLSLISGSDLEIAERFLIREVQREHFASEFKLLSEGKDCPALFKHLNPFLDDGIIRVGGRLSHANLSYDHKHPAVLPKRDPFINLVIEYYHKTNFHTGPNLVLSMLRQKFWILSGRGVVRKQLRACNFCFKHKPKSQSPLMGNLPAIRVNQAKAFLHTGVDYAGPFAISWTRRRGVRPQKAYVCVFVCLTIKAVHLELASDLSTQKFLSAFKRFISRRGPCVTVYSDCGTNFVGAKTKLKELYDLIQSNDYKQNIGTELASRRINWKLNPPYSPHFGGLWESTVKAMKSHLYRAIGTQILTFEEMTTILSQIEAILNTRPLYLLSSDPSEPSALTPAHFLNQQPLNSFPAEDFIAQPINHITRFQLLDKMVQEFWKRWHTEYLHNLQTRMKWNTPVNPVKAGMIVVVRIDNCPPLKWPLGIIEEVYPGSDNIVRVAKVRTRIGSHVRPVVRLCPLPSQ